MSEYLELKELPKNYISFTQYSQFLRCPRQFAYRYVEGLKIPPKSSLILGKGVHRGLEWAFGEHLRLGEPPKQNVVLDATLEAVENELKEIPKSEIDWVKGDSEGKIKDDGVNLVRTYEPHRLITIPKSVEKKFDIEFKNVDYKLTGRVDLETEKEIIDFKTTARKQSEESASQSDQLTIYQMQGEPKESLELHVLVRNKIPEYQILKSKPRSNEAVNDLLENIGKVATLIKAGIFPKVLENTAGSPCSWCGYYQLCRKKKRPE